MNLSRSPSPYIGVPSQLHRVGNFRQKNNSAKDGIDGTNGYFRRNSGCSAEQKTSEFRSESFRGRENNSEFRSVEQKIVANSQNSFPNPSAENIIFFRMQHSSYRVLRN